MLRRVHRNWLAITYSLPLHRWYVEATSQWTLDYPPFFAYFSWLLAQPAALVDSSIVDVNALDYDAWPCKLYMRATVLVTELVLGAALYAHYKCSPNTHVDTLLLASVFVHPGLLIVDHIHFQYNGFLLGVLLWSLWAARTQRPLLCALLFSSLLNLKHIFLYIAPAFTVYLFRGFLLPSGPLDMPALLLRTYELGRATLVPFMLSIGPILLSAVGAGERVGDALAHIVVRLFPFHRGLIHAYWAPNVWALYTFADRVLSRLRARSIPATSRGIVGDTAFGVLPDVSPRTCFVLALTFTCIYAVPLWRKPTYHALVACVTLCALTSFAVGWHVHEKAILLALVPLSLVAGRDYAHVRIFTILSATGIVSLFPLLFKPQETPVKLLYSGIWFFIVRQALISRVLRPMPSNIGAIVHALESVYVWGLAVIALVTNVFWPLAGAVSAALVPTHAEFMPLLATSVYCAVGVIWCWARLSYIYLVDAIDIW
ncbi:dolichyl-P-Glc:Glc1Man9GlcNAc2-PP-dolichol alpha-1,3-glucosyltransferase [Malassezia cuniculi]|uniref:Alpha-1,3-glucosyltransferase n=1 Tax=Malassezia cuniculi TaxID=948313 RepID=A0AAF0J7N5_9BASI|nr:dolichyl-P-Glc:Glc1Man9GlcNAc2-PP-dolichol alpha-1,3-glucosyltransferase [Malassezia cuniculi]